MDAPNTLFIVDLLSSLDYPWASDIQRTYRGSRNDFVCHVFDRVFTEYRPFWYSTMDSISDWDVAARGARNPGVCEMSESTTVIGMSNVVVAPKATSNILVIPCICIGSKRSEGKKTLGGRSFAGGQLIRLFRQNQIKDQSAVEWVRTMRRKGAGAGHTGRDVALTISGPVASSAAVEVASRGTRLIAACE